jgi:hypothetical protein
MARKKVEIPAEIRWFLAELASVRRERHILDWKEDRLLRALRSWCKHEEAFDNDGSIGRPRRCTAIGENQRCVTCPVCKMHLHLG